MKLSELDAFLDGQFNAADANRDGFITPAEFAVYYQSLGTCKARQQLRSSMGLEAESAPPLQYPSPLRIHPPSSVAPWPMSLNFSNTVTLLSTSNYIISFQ